MTTLGRYQLVRLIGQGGVGSVWEARDPRIGRRVAIKAIQLSFAEEPDLVRERLKREAGLAAILRHPNIVAVYDFDEADNTAFIVMEYITGHTLESLMKETNPHSWPQFVPLLAPCAAALDYAHSLGVVHCDMKPSNIMVQDDRTPKLLDFGLARLAYHSRLTGDGLNVKGTLSYLAPEVLRGEPSGPASDQFTLGIIAYRLLSARFPFVGDSTAGMLQNILNRAPRPIEELDPRISPDVGRATEKALSKDPMSRFGSCSEFVQAVYQPLASAGLLEESPYQNAAGLTGFGTVVTSRDAADAGPAAAARPGARITAMLPSWRQRIRDALSRLKPSYTVMPEQRELAASRHPAIPPSPTIASRFPEQPGAGEGTVILHRPLIQTRIDLKDLAVNQTTELISLAEQEEFERALALEGQWFPGPGAAEAPLLAFREAARYLIAAKSASSAHNVVDHLTRAEAVLTTAGNQLYLNPSALAAELPRALEVWKRVTRERLRTARARLELELPNPFRAGQPLRPDQGRPVFRGRKEIIRQIEMILADASQSGSIALLGPRRCGKTSLLQMLPSMLPDSVCIFFDLQDNPVDSTQSFFGALYQQAARQTYRDRRLELPRLPAGEIFASAMGWFQALDNLEGTFRILLCIDEFERLEDLFPGNRQDLLRLMGLLRATIQHRRKLRLLVSGVAPFDELGALWNDHFINARQLQVGHLDRSTALELLMRPLPDFPLQAIPENVAARIYERTGGQPYLLQLYGSLLIAQLNGEMRKVATLADIDLVEEDAMSQGTHYFRHTYESAPEPARTILEQLSKGQTPTMTPTVQRWLVRRELLTDEGALRMPVLGTFIRQELGLS